MSETYQHKAAKILLANWLSETEKESGDFCKLPPFEWRKNAGVHIELPIYETSDPYYFETEDSKTNILFRPDITVFHKGAPIYIIEIFHTHATKRSKLNLIKNYLVGFGGVEVHEVNTVDILRHDKKPKIIQTNIILVT